MGIIKLKIKIKKLIKKGKIDYNERWDASMIKYNKYDNIFTVITDDLQYCKSHFDADTLKCIGWESL